MQHKIVLLFFLATSYFTGFSQNTLSEKATISVITCGSGSELYSTFGHSAFRINDPLTGLDKIYNYGTFDFNAPNFYLNFAKGKLTYQLSTTNFHYFLREYQYENRWVKAQVLNLNQQEVKAIFLFLENNAKPENRAYQYDFFYDNCSTKIEEVIKTVLKDNIEFNNSHIKTTKSHRDLISDYTENQQWGKFGIDLALGSVIDREATKDEYKFLPDYIFLAFENATINVNSKKVPLVKEEQLILEDVPNHKIASIFSPTPFLVLLLLSMLIIWITYNNFKKENRTKYLDFFILFSTGIIGIVVLLLWFATSHTATYKNLNFLWAFAPNAIVAFYILKKNLTKWVLFYLKLLISLLLLTFIVWILKIQVFNLALLPLLLALLIRYLYLIRLKKEPSS